MKKYIEIRSLENNQVVKRKDVSDMDDWQVDRFSEGVKISIDHSLFCCEVVETNENLICT